MVTAALMRMRSPRHACGPLAATEWTSQAAAHPAHCRQHSRWRRRHNKPKAALGGTGRLVGRTADQCPHRRRAARRLLCRGDGRHFDLVRHPRHRQHRASGLHHPRLLHRLYRQPDARPRSDPDRHHRAAGVLRARRGGLSGLLRLVRETRPGRAARARVLLRPAVRHRGDADPGVRRRLPLRAGRLYRTHAALRLRRPAVPHAGPLRDVAADGRRCCSSICRAPSPAARSWRCRRTSWRCS